MTIRRMLPLVLVAACGAAPAADQPPALLGVPQVEYPPALFEQGVSGTVELHLFVDAAGRVVPDSTRITRSSGQAAMDTAALAAAPKLQYTPGTRNGAPVAMPFVQPIHFRHPGVGDSTR